MTQEISGDRKLACYLGNIITIIGLLVFISVFFMMMETGKPVKMGNALVENRSIDTATHGRSMAYRAIWGMVIMGIGGLIRGIGARGLAGAGVVLDPDQAREDLEPYSRMVGGMVKDALAEAEVNLGAKPEKVIMIKCRACGKLNEEDSKFCQACSAQF